MLILSLVPLSLNNVCQKELKKIGLRPEIILRGYPWSSQMVVVKNSTALEAVKFVGNILKCLAFEKQSIRTMITE